MRWALFTVLAVAALVGVYLLGGFISQSGRQTETTLRVVVSDGLPVSVEPAERVITLAGSAEPMSSDFVVTNQSAQPLAISAEVVEDLRYRTSHDCGRAAYYANPDRVACGLEVIGDTPDGRLQPGDSVTLRLTLTNLHADPEAPARFLVMLFNAVTRPSVLPNPA